MAKEKAKSASQPFYFNLHFWILLATSVWLVFSFKKDIFDPVLMPRQQVLSVGVAIGLLVLWVQSRKSPIQLRFPPLLAAFSALTLLSLFSVFWTYNSADTYYTVSKLSVITIFLCYSYWAISNKQLTAEHLIWVFVVLNILALLVLFKDANQIGFIKGKSAFEKALKGTFANPNLASAVLFLLSAGLLIFGRNLKVFSYVLIAANLLFIYLIGTKTVYLAIFVALLAFGLAWYSEKHKALANFFTKPAAMFGLSVLVIAASFGFLVFSLNNDQLSEWFGNNARFRIWNQTMLMIQDYPNGVGAGNWRLFFPKYGMDEFTQTFVDGIAHYQRPHNELLTAWAELGYAGLAIWIFIWGYLIYKAAEKSLKPTADDQPQLWALPAIIGFWIISFMDFPLERIEHNILLGTLAVWIVHAPSTEQITKSASKYGLLIFPLLPILALSFYVIEKRQEGEREIYKIQTSANPSTQRSLMLSQPEKAFNPYFSVDPTSAPVFYFSALASYMNKDYSKAKEEFIRAEALHPYHLHVLNALGSCYATLGNQDSAMIYYEKALNVSPSYQKTILNLAELKLQNKELETAYELLSRIAYSNWDERTMNNIRILIFNMFDERVKSQEYNDTQRLNFCYKTLEQRYSNAFYKFVRNGISPIDYFDSLYIEGRIIG